MLRSRAQALAMAALVALTVAGCGSSRRGTEADFRYPAAGLLPVAPNQALTAPRAPGAPANPPSDARARAISSSDARARATSPSAPRARAATPSAVRARAAAPNTPSARAALPPGTSEVASALGRPVSVYRSARNRRPERRFSARNPFGVTQVFLVKRAIPGWLEVYLPVRPNDATAWVRARSVRVTLDRYQVVVDTARHEIMAFRAGRLALHAAAGIGKPGTPTPHGLFYVLETLRMIPPTGPYGRYALGISGYSNVLTTFGTGDAQVALHGTNEPWTVGQSTSNGCVHLSVRVVSWLARTLPLGTPVLID